MFISGAAILFTSIYANLVPLLLIVSNLVFDKRGH